MKSWNSARIMIGVVLGLGSLFLTEVLSEATANTMTQLIAAFFFIEMLLLATKLPHPERQIASFRMLLNTAVLLSFVPAFMTGYESLEGLRPLVIIRALPLIPLLHSFWKACTRYKAELNIFLSSTGLIILIGSLSMYVLEHEVNADINSLGDAFWWAIVTLSTVGYGEIVPITLAGRITSGVLILGGLSSIAILTGLITKIFLDHFFGKRQTKCKQCAYPHHDFDARYCKNCSATLPL